MNFIKNLAALFKVKTIVTIVIIFVFAYLSVTGEIPADNVMIIVSSVVAFYFGTWQDKK